MPLLQGGSTNNFNSGKNILKLSVEKKIGQQICTSYRPGGTFSNKSSGDKSMWLQSSVSPNLNSVKSKSCSLKWYLQF